VAKEEIQSIREASIVETEQVDAEGNVKKVRGGINPTEGQKDKLKAIERNIGKQPYDVGIRGIYCAPKDAAYSTMGGILANLFKPFNSEEYNSLMPTDGRWSNHFNDYPWEDAHGHHVAHANHSVLEFYRKRAFFHP